MQHPNETPRVNPAEPIQLITSPVTEQNRMPKLAPAYHIKIVSS